MGAPDGKQAVVESRPAGTSSSRARKPRQDVCTYVGSGSKREAALANGEAGTSTAMGVQGPVSIHCSKPSPSGSRRVTRAPLVHPSPPSPSPKLQGCLFTFVRPLASQQATRSITTHAANYIPASPPRVTAHPVVLRRVRPTADPVQLTWPACHCPLPPCRNHCDLADDLRRRRRRGRRSTSIHPPPPSPSFPFTPAP